MRRNLDLIEKILTLVRNNQGEYVPQTELVNECSADYTEPQVQHHLMLCCDAGFLATDGRSAYTLTWKGHLAAESPVTTIYGKD